MIAIPRSSARTLAIPCRPALALGLALGALGLGGCNVRPPVIPSLAEGQIGGAVSAVALDGDMAWLGAGQRLQGVDLRDRGHPLARGQSAALPSPIRALSVRDGLAFAAIGVDGLALLDVSDPDRPRHVTTWPTRWAINDLAIVGDRIYLAEGALGLRIVARPVEMAVAGGPSGAARPAGVPPGGGSDPVTSGAVHSNSDPTTLGTVNTPGDALAVIVDGDLAYVADWGTGLRIIDVADASAPREIAFLDTPGEAADVAMAGELLLIADRSGGLRIIDVSEPSEPREVGALELGGPAERVAGADAMAYVAAQAGGLASVDLRDPRRPRPTGRLAGVAVAVDLALDADYLYVADTGSALPPQRDSRDDLWARVHVWGAETRPEVALGMAALHVADRRPDGALRPVGVYGSPSLVEAVAVDAARALMYAADGQAGILVFDLVEAGRPVLIGRTRTPGLAHDLVLDEGWIYVADGPAGLTLLERSDPRVPTLARSIATPDDAFGVALGERDLVYVAARSAGLVVVDSRAGVQVGPAMESPGFAWDVTRRGNRLYLAERSWGLRVFDVAEPGEPRELGHALEGRGDVLDIAFRDELAWVAAGPSGVFALDLREPHAATIVGQVVVEDRAIGLVLEGETAYVAAGGAGLRALDISKPSAPREIAAWSFPGAAERLAQFGDFVYVSAEAGGLQVLRLR